MNPKEIELLIRNFEVSATDEMDKWVCRDVLKVIRKPKQAKSIKAKPRFWKATKLAVAAGLIIAVFVGIDYFGGSIDIATPTFADVIRPFLSARTATFTITTEGPNGQPSFSMKGMFAEPGRMRYEFTGAVEMVQIFDMQKGEIVNLMPKEKTATVIEMANMSIEKQRKANMFFDIRRQLQQAQDAKNGNVEFLGERQIDGINTDGYLLKEELGIEMTVWVDAEGLLPVRIEYDMSEMFGKQMKMVMSDFEFNVELDESLFSLEIPEGYTIQTIQMDASEPLEKDLIEMFGVWADVTGGKFPSALGLNVEVIKEFSTALTGDLFKQESQEYPEDKEQLHQLLDEIKQDQTQLQGIIQDDENKENLHLLAETIKSHLQQLLDFKEQKEKAKQRYRDELTSRAKNLASDPFKNVQEIQKQMQPITRGLAFVQKLPVDSDWHYAGKAVKYGDGNTPIFWYRPKELGICRIIFGDLSIEDVDLSEQPKEPEVFHDETVEDAKDLKHPLGATRSLTNLLIAGEDDFIESLGIWTDFTDGKFPASLASIDIIRDFRNYQNERLSKDGLYPPDNQVLEMRADITSIMNEIRSYILKGLMFARILDANSDWHYAGKGVSVGDSDKAIFWYKPKGSNKYRVIYADLTVEETTADQLPVDSGKTQGYKDLHKEKPSGLIPKDDPAAVEIFKGVQATYDALETYRSVCEVIADYDKVLIFDVNNFPDLTQEEIEQLEQNPEFKKIFNRSRVTNTSLIMTLARPKLYCIQWTTGDETQGVWSDDNGYYGIYSGEKKFYDHFSLLGGPWGSSKTVPTIFYNRHNNTLKKLVGLVKEEDDTVEGQLCYVISGLHHNKVVRLWISREQLLILKREYEINFESRTHIRTKRQIKKILKAMGKEVTPDAIELMQKRIKKGFAKSTIVKGTSIETHRDIIVDEPVSKEELEPSESKMLKQ